MVYQAVVSPPSSRAAAVVEVLPYPVGAEMSVSLRGSAASYPLRVSSRSTMPAV